MSRSTRLVSCASKLMARIVVFEIAVYASSGGLGEVARTAFVDGPHGDPRQLLRVGGGGGRCGASGSGVSGGSGRGSRPNTLRRMLTMRGSVFVSSKSLSKR